jgi:uncharacterized protein
MRSRVTTTRRLAEAINAMNPLTRPKVFVSASAVGFYGASDYDEFDEDSKSGSDYLAEVR